ncbi:hypothetical protein FIBSPDRAFT_883013 [Athelia psychrophila]|uniref:Uncharacterized protein n=1 Tax=Athelia psychrophila TaxID=1759441 RepID=A0A166UGW6_9AGAM|nr:hypothetical protein FIBSPDRAFT_883013 [Fibularhizoctonia sp. CBS 109695]
MCFSLDRGFNVVTADGPQRSRYTLSNSSTQGFPITPSVHSSQRPSVRPSFQRTSANLGVPAMNPLQAPTLITARVRRELRSALEAAKEPSLPPHLTTSDALNVPEDPVESAPRKRTESAISRFFPGGWFTSSPTIPDVIKTRTSTDVATGEFIRSASQDSAQSEPAVTPVVSPGDEETKSRWCTIM